MAVKSTVLLTAIGFFVTLILLATVYLPGETKQSDSYAHGYRVSKPRQDIIGFKYDCLEKGKKTVSLSADRIIIRKKKVGFFRFSLFEEIYIKNGSAAFFNKDEGDQALPKINVTGPHGDQSELGLISDLLPYFTTNNIASFTIAPVYIEFNANDYDRTTITAKEAIYREKEKDILFSGGIQIANKTKKILSNKAAFRPQEKTFIVYRYTMTTPEGTTNGTNFVSDVYLNETSL